MLFSRDLIHVGLHKHLCELEIFLHFIQFLLHSDRSVLVFVLDFVDFALFFGDLVLDDLVFVALVLDLPFNSVNLVNQTFFMN